MTRETWLARHPYLQPLADWHARVEAAMSEVGVATASIPKWDDYLADFQAGVPLLQSAAVGIELSVVNQSVDSLIIRLASQHAGSPAGLRRFLGCTVLARFLSPVVGAFARWRDEERWLRSYCPTCGEPPAMGQLIGKDPGRMRFLLCGCCRTRWRYRRTGCPFCDSQDEHRLSVLAVDGEEGLRIDYCEACRGYLKTYSGEGNELLLLADWTSLHLDLLARDRGLKRLAASLYEL